MPSLDGLRIRAEFRQDFDAFNDLHLLNHFELGEQVSRSQSKSDPWQHQRDWSRVLKGGLIVGVGLLLMMIGKLPLGIIICVYGSYDLIFGLAGEMGVW